MRAALLLFTLVMTLASTVAAGSAAETSCLSCHSDPDSFEDHLLAIAQGFDMDIHGEVGLSCHDCHGGNPDPEAAEDMDAAMDSGFETNPYRGVPTRVEIPAFCGRCHSDPDYMRRFKPDPRVDQEQEYRTSHHGVALANGNERVATCVDCHGTHDIRSTDDAQAPVYPAKVAQTCGSCHNDAEWMAGSTLPDGRPLPTDQLARWSRSVHAQAMFEKGDLSAPTCNDCHGNHGAAPPGVESVAFVCGQCHGRETELFRKSPKHLGLQDHNEYLAEAGPDGCADCHEAPEPQAAITDLRTFSECTTCHQNHAIIRPTVAMLGNLPDTPCAFCHELPTTSSESALDLARTQEHYQEMRAALMGEAEVLGLEGNRRFDWLVDRTLTLPTHTILGSGGDGHVLRLRPEFDRLYRKFRIGKTSYSFEDPVTGTERHEDVVTCNRCHGETPGLADEMVGSETAAVFLEQMRLLTARTAAAERLLLATHRGGVEVRDGLTELDGAVNAQIELEVLVHTFSADEEDPFVKKSVEGLEHADAALELARGGLDELTNRRRGLFVALAFIILTAAGLILWIRQ